MTCKCKEHGVPDADAPHWHDPKIRPGEPCPLCAEKHLATAAALAREMGYEGVNWQWIVGELVCAAWHLAGDPTGLAFKIRDTRHVVQFNESPVVDWDALFALIGPPARAAAAKG